MAIKRSTLIISSIMVLAVALSILLYIFQGYPKVDRIFFFPQDHSLITSGEARNIPRHSTEEENIEEYMREWLLGPLVLEHRHLFPRNTELLTLLFRDGVLYLDFSMNILIKSDESPLNFDEILGVITHGAVFNFPYIESVVFTIEGEPVPPPKELNKEEEKTE